MFTLMDILIEHFTHLRQIFLLAKAHLIKTYKGSALGWSWAIINPSITIAVYYFAFTVGLRVGKPVNGYPYFLWLISGMCPWFYVRSTFVGGAGAIRVQRYLVTKIRYPVSTLPTVICFSELITHVALVIVVLIIFCCFGFMPDLYWIQIPMYTVMMFLFMDAWSLFASVVSAMSADFYQLVRSTSMVLFWMSGILYNVNAIDNFHIRRFMRLNPVTTIVSGYRSALIDKSWFWENGNILLLRNFFVVYACMLTVAVFTYRKLGKELPDVL